MKKGFFVVLVALMLLSPAFASPASAGGGFDEWGYNYQANLFNGYYCDAYQDADWCQPYRDVRLQMKWNDAWLDENGNRHEGHESYVGSGAWLTNHMRGQYEQDGDTCNWEYFVKIKAAPSGGYEDAGWWYSSDDTLLGYEIWDNFYVVQEVINDPCAGEHGRVSIPVNPGLGN